MKAWKPLKKRELIAIRKSGEILSTALREVVNALSADQAGRRLGTSAFELDQLAERTIRKSGGTPSFKGFSGEATAGAGQAGSPPAPSLSPFDSVQGDPERVPRLSLGTVSNSRTVEWVEGRAGGSAGQEFPSSLCVSINDEVVHGVPRREKVIRQGDLVGLDLGVVYHGMYTDMATTVAVGKVSSTARRLLEVTRKALRIALSTIRDGSTVGDLGQAVQSFVESQGFGVIRDLVGHGVGRAVHEDPRVPNFGKGGSGEVLKRGMVLAIEPMVTERGFAIVTDDDGWTIRTRDGGLAAHEERTVIVTQNGFEFLTPWDESSA